jgi:hypothetical protein
MQTGFFIEMLNSIKSIPCDWPCPLSSRGRWHGEMDDDKQGSDRVFVDVKESTSFVESLVCQPKIALKHQR